MSNGAVVRHPLGLPAGSVRGMLSLLIAIQLWLLLLLPDSSKITIPINLYLMLTLVVIFFVSHGKSIANAAEPTASPLYLPGGTLRVVILGGTIAVIAFLYVNHPDRLVQRLRPTEGQIAIWPSILGAYLGGFFVGYLFSLMPFKHNWMFQAFSAWVSIITTFLLFVEIIIQAFINPSLKVQYDLQTWGVIVTSVVSYYFGMRS